MNENSIAERTPGKISGNVTFRKVRAGVTPKPAIERALSGLDTSKVLGLVLNWALLLVERRALAWQQRSERAR